METMVMKQGTDLIVSRESWELADRRLARRSWRSPIGIGFALMSLGVAAVLLRVAVVGFPVDFNAILISLGVTAIMLRFAVVGL